MRAFAVHAFTLLGNVFSLFWGLRPSCQYLLEHTAVLMCGNTQSSEVFSLREAHPPPPTFFTVRHYRGPGPHARFPLCRRGGVWPRLLRSPPGLRKAICERVAGEGVFRTSPDLLSSRAAYSNIWVPVTRSTRSSRSPSWVGPALTHFHYSLSDAFCFSRFEKTSFGSRVPSTIYCRLGWPFLAGRCRARWPTG